MRVAGFVRGYSVNFIFFYNPGCQIDESVFNAGFFFDSNSESIKVELKRIPSEDSFLDGYIDKYNYGYKAFACFSCSIPKCASYLSGNKIVSSIKFEFDGESVEYISPELGLEVTLFSSFNSFHKRFSFSRGRHIDPETVIFIAHNNLSTDVCRSPTVWVTSFTIYCYKYLEIFSVKSKDMSRFFEKAESVCSILSDEEKSLETVRVDPQSRCISIYTSYLHYLVSFSEFDLSSRLTDKIFQIVDLNNIWKYDYNFSRLIAFKMALERDSGASQFYVDLIRTVILRKRSEALETMAYVHIKEFSETLELISYILRFSEEKKLNNWQRNYLVRSASRVRENIFLDRLKKSFEGFSLR